VERLGSGLDAAFYLRELVIRHKSSDFDRFSHKLLSIYFCVLHQLLNTLGPWCQHVGRSRANKTSAVVLSFFTRLYSPFCWTLSSF
jgi:hypothetical protein